jgi:hypothetical protein
MAQFVTHINEDSGMHSVVGRFLLTRKGHNDLQSRQALGSPASSLAASLSDVIMNHRDEFVGWRWLDGHEQYPGGRVPLAFTLPGGGVSGGRRRPHDERTRKRLMGIDIFHSQQGKVEMVEITAKEALDYLGHVRSSVYMYSAKSREGAERELITANAFVHGEDFKAYQEVATEDARDTCAKQMKRCRWFQQSFLEGCHFITDFYEIEKYFIACFDPESGLLTVWAASGED